MMALRSLSTPPGGLDTTAVHQTGNETAAGNKTWTGNATFDGPMYVKAVNRPNTLDSYGGDPSGATDCGAAITAALAGYKGVIEPHPRGTYRTSTTIQLPTSNFEYRGARAGVLQGTGVWVNGPQFLWSGAAGGTVVEMVGAEDVVLRGLNIDGGGVAAVTCLLIDSVNNPATYNLKVSEFFMQRFGGIGGGTGYGIRIGQSIVNDYQMDRITVEEGTCYYGDIGISIESDNACDGSIFKRIELLSCNQGLRVLACGEMSFDGLIFGGFVGSDPAYISLGQRGSGVDRYNPLTFRSCQGEMPSTTLAVGSNGASLPQSTIYVAGTVLGQPSVGSFTILVQTSAGLELVTATGSTGTTFTGCTGGTGTMATGGEVWPGYMMVVFGTPDTAQPLNLISNTFGGPADVTIQRRVLTEGNYFGGNFYLSGPLVDVYPRGDTFGAGKTFLPLGSFARVGTPLWIAGTNGQGVPPLMSAVLSGAPTIAGVIGDICVRQDTGAVYRCTATGAAGSATWTTP